MGRAFEDRVEIHLGEQVALVVDSPPRDHLEAVEQRLGLAPPMRLDHADDDIDAVLAPGLRRKQHLVGLADAGRGAEKNLQPPPPLAVRGASKASVTVADRSPPSRSV